MEILKTLVELKAEAYDCAVQVKAWQEKLSAVTQQINNYVEQVPDSKGKDKK